MFASRPESFFAGLQEKLKENDERYINTDTNTNTNTNTNSKSSLDLSDLINEKMLGAKIVLCPQHIPKFHPRFDYILNRVLAQVPNCILVVLGIIIIIIIIIVIIIGIIYLF